jgi:serine O-acetyltransferase
MPKTPSKLRVMGLMERLIYARNKPLIGVLIHQALLLLSVEIPQGVRIGKDLRVEHRGNGLVISANTRIGDRVRLFHQVTTGTKDNLDGTALPREAIILRDDVVVYPGARILGGAVPTVVGTGTIVNANAVVTRSTGEWEVWAGVPARKVGVRIRRPEY